MLSDLALIDWIALVFAAVLLAAAAAAGLVAYATAKHRPKGAHSPAHAISSTKATTPPPPTGMPVEMKRMAPSPDVPGTPVRTGARAPQPELVGVNAEHAAVSGETVQSSSSVLSDGVLLEPSSPEATVAARAAKLRRRPVPETDSAHKRIVSAVEPKRMPAHAPNRAFAHAGAGQLSIDTDMPAAEGFAARTPGFFEDPVGRHELRYWDGHRWTEYVKEHGERFTDPL